MRRRGFKWRSCYSFIKISLLHFLASMKSPDEFLDTFDQTWNDFSAAWKKARRKASEKAVHDLRVNTRRLTATLELTRSLSKHEEIVKLQRGFKKVLKAMGPL